MEREKCGRCDGRGLVMTQNGEDDVNQDTCDYCDGKGWIESEIKMYVKDLVKKDTDVEEVYKCPKCGEFELRPERIGHRDEDFERWDLTGLWICDNPDCGAEFREEKDGELRLQ